MKRGRAGVGLRGRWIRSADASVLPSGDGPAPYFVGEPKKLRLLSSYAVSSVPGGGFRLLCFFEAERSTGGAGLSLADASPFRPGGVGAWDGTEDPRGVLPGGADGGVSYSPGPSDEGEWEWFDAWDRKERGGLPRAVRVEFTTQSETGPLTNAFVVPVMAGGAG